MSNLKVADQIMKIFSSTTTGKLFQCDFGMIPTALLENHDMLEREWAILFVGITVQNERFTVLSATEQTLIDLRMLEIKINHLGQISASKF